MCVLYFMVKGGPVQVSPYIVHVGFILCVSGEKNMCGELEQIQPVLQPN